MQLDLAPWQLGLLVVAALIFACYFNYFCLFGAKETFALVDVPVTATVNSAKDLIIRPINKLVSMLTYK